MKILVTGFTPFGGESINPSYEAVKLLPKEVNGASIMTLEVETAYSKAFLSVKDAIDSFHPDIVLLIGQAGGRKTITLEKVAINLMDSTIPDNCGDRYVDKKILVDGPDAYFTTLDIASIKKALNDLGYPVNISYTAGTFVCNYLMYQVLNYAKDKGIKVDFIHVPYADLQVKNEENPSMSIDKMGETLKEILKFLTK